MASLKFREINPSVFRYKFKRHFLTLCKKPPEFVGIDIDLGRYLWEQENGVLTHMPFNKSHVLIPIVAALRAALPVNKGRYTKQQASLRGKLSQKKFRVNVAEFASGTGQIGDALQKEGYTVASFDRNHKSINFGKERGIRGGMVADAIRVPLKDGSVDAIVSKDFLNSDYPGIGGLNRYVLPEASRILKKGGIVILAGAEKVPYMTWTPGWYNSLSLGKCWKVVFSSRPDEVGNYFHVLQKIADDKISHSDLEKNLEYFAAKYGKDAKQSGLDSSHSILAAIKTHYPWGFGSYKKKDGRLNVLQIAQEPGNLGKLLSIEGAKAIVTPGEPANLFFGPNQLKNGEVPLSKWKLPAADSSMHAIVSDGFLGTKSLSRRREGAIISEAQRALSEGGIIVLQGVKPDSTEDYDYIEGLKKIYEGNPAGKSDWMVVLQKETPAK